MSLLKSINTNNFFYGVCWQVKAEGVFYSEKMQYILGNARL
jgi:hypothetical protein